MTTILIMFIIIATVEFVMIVNFIEEIEQKEELLKKLFKMLLRTNSDS